MTTVHGLTLAGQLNDLSDSWITMFKDWATKGLQAGLVVLVVVIMIQKFSLKAGIGALKLGHGQLHRAESPFPVRSASLRRCCKLTASASRSACALDEGEMAIGPSAQ
ncbi:hypothetical protein AB0K74_29295 [Streptomyces sp. NPDC056159]|uniref:hypothetical protein n=1 Tax=unclassified Streptomyces TaxID=2593676 RepID=UPI003435A242